MIYCKEYFDWNETDGEWSFTIKDVSTGMVPGDVRNVTCDGVGFIRMIKEIDGTLMLEMKNGLVQKFVDVKHQILK